MIYYLYNIHCIKLLFSKLIKTSPVIRKIAKNILSKDIYYYTEKELKDYLDKLANNKFNIFMINNKDIPLYDIYNYLDKLLIYNGDISNELITI